MVMLGMSNIMPAPLGFATWRGDYLWNWANSRAGMSLRIPALFMRYMFCRRIPVRPHVRAFVHVIQDVLERVGVMLAVVHRLNVTLGTPDLARQHVADRVRRDTLTVAENRVDHRRVVGQFDQRVRVLPAHGCRQHVVVALLEFGHD